MNKTLLIIQREYLSRVRKKSFIIMTFLVPMLFIGMYALVGYLFVKKDALSEKKNVVVNDQTGYYTSKFHNSATLHFTYQKGNIDSIRKDFETSASDYLLQIPSGSKNILLLGHTKPGISTISEIESQLNEIDRVRQLMEAGIDTSVLNDNKGNYKLITRQLTEEGEKDSSSWLAYGIGFAGAFLIYMSLFIYGVQVMRGVIEEKTNRIIEVIISSVKPFQLMLGKIIGVGMVGLTQFLLWIVLSLSVAGAAGSILLKDTAVEKVKKEHTVDSPDLNKSNFSNDGVFSALKSVPLFYTLGTFLFYFLFGFLLYSSIFAAVGSAVDNETETQQFMLPITMPLIFTFIISINFVINDPDSNLSLWLSLIPFTSPIAMMIRIPFGVPPEQLALSMFLLIVTFLFITWVASRIYRVGILMYGKKSSYRELIKWFMYKE